MGSTRNYVFAQINRYILLMIQVSLIRRRGLDIAFGMGDGQGSIRQGESSYIIKSWELRTCAFFLVPKYLHFLGAQVGALFSYFGCASIAKWVQNWVRK